MLIRNYFNNMKRFAIILGALILMGAGCANTPRKSSLEQNTPKNEARGDESKVTIEMTPEGYNPPAVDIKIGTTVTFVNKDTVPRWPASGMHPTHQLCPGFDSRNGIAPGESYSFKFMEAKTCPFHDHLYPKMRGSITVEE